MLSLLKTFMKAVLAETDIEIYLVLEARPFFYAYLTVFCVFVLPLEII